MSDRKRQGRRRVMKVLGSVAAVGVFGCGNGGSAASPTSATTSTSACVVKPQLTEGPYFVDELLNRSDIRSDPGSGTLRPGTALRLTFRVTRAADCAPLANVVVDVWQCDALGVYSDVSDAGFNTVGQRFLRGYQVTDAAGQAQFTTVYPGWYSGRAVHIHFKARTSPGATSGFEFTSQLFFDESVTDQVHAQAPYSSKGRRNTTNASDGIYQGGGSQLLLTPTADSSGYAATLEMALQL